MGGGNVPPSGGVVALSAPDSGTSSRLDCESDNCIADDDAT